MNLFTQFRHTLAKYGLEYFNKYYGVYTGEVYDNKDPDNLGRIKLKVRSIYGNDFLDKWAHPRGMYIGARKGLFAIPAIGDSVWVSFENGDPRFPIWEYGKTVEPPQDVSDLGQSKIVILVTEKGNKIAIYEEDNQIKVRTAGGGEILLEDGEVKIHKQGSVEPAILGDTAADLFKELISDIGNVGAITTNTGVTSTINTSPLWAPLVTKWNTKFETMKSKFLKIE